MNDEVEQATLSELQSKTPPRFTPPGWVSDAVVRVGEGRGFVPAPTDADEPLIITCAHVVAAANEPVAHPFGGYDRIYPKFVGLLGEEPTLMAECVFSDACGDVAVLAAPDTQTLSDEHDAFVEFCQERKHLPISPDQRADFPFDRDVGWLLGLDGSWRSHELHVMEQWIHFGVDADTGGLVEGGMSGSPIVSLGTRIGAVGLAASTEAQPRLATTLPPWILRRVIVR